MSRGSWQAARAVFLAAIMVTSVFAAGIAFSGSAAAQDVGTENSTYPSPDPANFDYVVDTDGDLSDDDGISGSEFNNTYDSLTAAIGSADENNKNILVLPGEYQALNKSGQSVDTDNVMLASSEGPQETVINSPDSQGIRVGSESVTVKGFKIRSQKSAGIYLTSSAADATIEYNIISDTTGDPVNATNGIRVEKRSATIRHNLIENHEQGITIAKNFEPSDRVLINENRFVNNGLAGVYIFAKGSTSSDHLITHNSFSGTIEQYNTGSDVIPLGGDILLNEGGADIKNISVHFNEFDSAGTGISTLDSDSDGFTEAVEATNNYWGSENGPSADGENTYNDGEQGAEVSDNVEFTPWLDNSTDNGGEEFAPVTNNSNGQFASIQGAVDANSDTITVSPGTYEESVTVNIESLTLKGPNAGTPGDDERSEEATITQGVEVSADGVTVDGLEVTNDDVNGIVVTGAPSDVTVTNTVVRDIAGGTAGASKGVGNGINLQFNDAFEQTSTGIEITDNLITNITTADASGRDPDADAIGVQLLPRGNDVENLRIAGNTIENIEPGAAPGGRSEARAVSIATQFTNTSDGERGDFGQATNLTVADNEVSNLTADFARAVALFEDSEGAAKTPDNRVGPVDFTVTGNNVSNVNSEADFFDRAIFIGEYGDFGDDHIVENNEFNGAAVENFGDSDALNTDGNTFSGDPKFDIHYTAANADLSSIIDSNTFDKRVTVKNASGDFTGDTILAGIQTAVDSASSGDTVSVGPGTYEESVTVDVDGLTLTAVDKTEDSTIVTDDHKEIIEVAASDVTVEGFTVTSPEDPNSNYGSYAVRVLSEDGPVSDVTIRNNTVKTVRDVYRASGISVSSGVSDNELVDISIENNSVKDIAATQESTDAGNSIAKGIVFNQQVKSSEIDGNTIVDIGGQTSSAAHGIAMDGGGPTNFTVQNNEIDNLEAVGTGDDPYFNEANAIIVGGYADLGGEHTVKSNNILDGQVYRFDAGPDTDLLVAPLNWWGTERGPNGDSDASVRNRGVAYDPFLTTSIENIEVNDVGDTKQFAQDVIAPTDQDVTAVGFPGPVPDDYTVGDAFENADGGIIYEYDRDAGTFVQVTGSEDINALDAFLVVQNSDTSDESTQVVIQYADTPDPGPAELTTIEPGFNLISPRSLGDAYGAFDAPSDRETIYGTYGAPLPRSESAFLGPADQDTNFIETTFGPNQDDPVVTPYGGYLVFTQEERDITTFVQRGTTADEVINNLNQTAA